MGDHVILFLAGAVLGSILLGVGGFFGYRSGKNRRSPELGLDRQQLLELLRKLGAWTSEYSGNVSRYQDELGALAGNLRNDSAKNSPEVLALLRKVMQSNQNLKKRLDAAENQLEKQTRQIENYLSEARTDGLTGLANRRAFDQRLNEMFLQYRKGTGRTFCLALIDIDHFKKINDRHGHQAGDDVLRQVSSILASEMDNAYLVARYGGEEFAILLPAPLQFASDRADKMRKVLAEHALESGGTPIPVTLSVGLSEIRDEAVSAPLIRRADEALYAAKGRGRNRVYFHDGVQPRLVGAPEIVS